MPAGPEKVAPQESLSRSAGGLISGVIEKSVDLAFSIAALVLVGQRYGAEGLGVYSYLLSLYVLSWSFIDWGVSRYVESEIALRKSGGKEAGSLLSEGLRAILISSAAGVVIFLFFGLVAGERSPRLEHSAAYVILALSLPLCAWNKLGIAVLHGRGDSSAAAALEGKKDLFSLGLLVALLLVRVPPSLLVMSLAGSELLLFLFSRGKAGLPGPVRALRGFGGTSETLRRGYRVLLTERTFSAVMYIDFFILGLFVPAGELGVYASVSVLARAMLIVPMGAQPVFRRLYCHLAPVDGGALASLFRRATRHFFLLQSFLLLLVLNYFPALHGAFFSSEVQWLEAHRLLLIMAPGLLFYSSIAPSEPLYEALGRTESLRKIVTAVFLTNLALNFYLVPYAGFSGAAAASSLSMFLYFLLLGQVVGPPFRLPLTGYLIAGGGVYLVHTVASSFETGPLVTLLIILSSLTLTTSMAGLSCAPGEEGRQRGKMSQESMDGA